MFSCGVGSRRTSGAPDRLQQLVVGQSLIAVCHENSIAVRLGGNHAVSFHYLPATADGENQQLRLIRDKGFLAPEIPVRHSVPFANLASTVSTCGTTSFSSMHFNRRKANFKDARNEIESKCQRKHTVDRLNPQPACLRHFDLTDLWTK